MYVNRQGLQSLISYLKDRLDTTGKQPTAAHRVLARLPIALVASPPTSTTFWSCVPRRRQRVEIVVKDTAIPFMRHDPNSVNIVKLYGTRTNRTPSCSPASSTTAFFLQRPQMVKLLEIELAHSDTLYLGWSGTDPYFQMIFGESSGPLRPDDATRLRRHVRRDRRERAELVRRQIRLDPPTHRRSDCPTRRLA